MMMEVSSPPEYASTTFSGMGSPCPLEGRREAMNAAAEQHQQYRLLHVQSILGLVENDGPRRVDYAGSDLVSTMRRQTVQEQRVGRGMREELLVDLIRRERGFALCRFTLLPHAGPDIRVNGIHAGHSLLRIIADMEGSPGGRGDLLRATDDSRIRLVARGSGDMNRAAEAGSRQQQRMGDIVSVSHVRKFHFAQIAEFLLQGQVIRQRLAGMLEIAEAVDHGNIRMLGNRSDGCVIERAQDNAVDPTFEIVRDVAQRFSRIETGIGLIEEERAPTQAVDAGFERK